MNYALESLPWSVWVNWWEVVPILDDGTGPSEPTGDYAEVWAPSKREALWAAYRSMKENPPKERWQKGWPEIQEADGLHPLHGMKAELAICHHGICWLTAECPDCNYELEQHIAAEVAAGEQVGA